jgi:hypothetical protein
MAGFVLAHLFQYGARSDILLREILKVAIEMINDLVFGCLDKAQAHFVSDHTGRCAYRERCPIKDGVEPAGFPA